MNEEEEELKDSSEEMILKAWFRLKYLVKKKFSIMEEVEKEDLVNEALTVGIKRGLFTEEPEWRTLRSLLLDAYASLFKVRKSHGFFAEVEYKEQLTTLPNQLNLLEMKGEFLSEEEEEFQNWIETPDGVSNVARIKESRYYTNSLPFSVGDLIKYLASTHRSDFRAKPAKNPIQLSYVGTSNSASELPTDKAHSHSKEKSLLREENSRFYTDSLPMTLQEKMVFCLKKHGNIKEM